MSDIVEPDPVFENLSKQTAILKYLKNFIVNSIDKVKAANRTERHYEHWLDLLKNYWLEFFKNNLELVLYFEDLRYKDNNYFKQDHYAEGENYYIAAADQLQNEMDALNAANSSTPPAEVWVPASASQQNFALSRLASHPTPKIPIPTFSGMHKTGIVSKNSLRLALLMTVAFPIKLNWRISSITWQAPLNKL